MASRNISTKTTAERLAGLISEYYAKKSGLTQITTDVGNAIKAATYSNNTLKLFRSTDTTGEAAFSFDLPEELFLDQAKTAFVGNFTWSDAAYPGSTDPNLNGKPVMVLAIKGDTATTYSFLNMETLVDTYSAKAGDGSAVVTVSGYEISVNVNVSEDADNILTKDASGKLKVVAPDVSGKANKVSNATDGNLAGLNANGDLIDSGVAAGDVQIKVVPAAAGNIASLNAQGQVQDSGVPAANVQVKTAPAAAGNMASLAADGTLQDSGIPGADVLTTGDISDYTEAELRTLLGLPAAE